MTKDKILAMPAGREMDRFIAEKVMGCRVLISTDGQLYCRCGMTCNYPHAPDDRDSQLYGDLYEFSTDIAAAWEVVEKLRERFAQVAIDVCGDLWRARLYLDSDTLAELFADATEDTAPLAICRAALLANHSSAPLPPPA